MGKRTRRRNRSAQPGAGTIAPPDGQSLREAVARRIVGQALDLAVPPERVADSVLAFYEGQHVPGELASGRLPRSRARDVARRRDCPAGCGEEAVTTVRPLRGTSSLRGRRDDGRR
jgi:hypothetical protein